MNKKVLFLMSTTIMISLLLTGIAYAKYQKAINVTYTATTGEMICDVEIETSDDYTINGIPYFLVKVRNYTGENEAQTLTATDIDYTLTIKNADNSTYAGMFIWQNVDNKTNTAGKTYINSYQETVTIDGYSFEKTAEEHTFKIFVKNSNKSITRTTPSINVEVVLSAVQKEES